MQKIKNFILLVGLFLLISNCSKDVPLMSLEYAETKCSDPWRTNEGNSEAEVINALMAYLENDLNVPNVTIKTAFDANDAQSCEACDYTTGRTITLTVEEGFVAILEDHGFI
ncbi:MAG: hypothetical protein AB8G86_27020 [Saprospiraceae bacterium]